MYYKVGWTLANRGSVGTTKYVAFFLNNFFFSSPFLLFIFFLQGRPHFVKRCTHKRVVHVLDICIDVSTTSSTTPQRTLLVVAWPFIDPNIYINQQFCLCHYLSSFLYTLTPTHIFLALSLCTYCIYIYMYPLIQCMYVTIPLIFHPLFLKYIHIHMRLMFLFLSFSLFFFCFFIWFCF